MTQLLQATMVRVGDCVYDNRHHDWLYRWPTVTKTERIAAGRVALHTASRLFVYLPEEPVLTRRGAL